MTDLTSSDPVLAEIYRRNPPPSIPTADPQDAAPLPTMPAMPDDDAVNSAKSAYLSDMQASEPAQPAPSAPLPPKLLSDDEAFGAKAAPAASGGGTKLLSDEEALGSATAGEPEKTGRTSFLANVTAPINRGVAGVLGLPGDVQNTVTGWLGLGDHGVAGTDEFAHRMTSLGMNDPNQVHAVDAWGRMGAGAGEAATMALSMLATGGASAAEIAAYKAELAAAKTAGQFWNTIKTVAPDLVALTPEATAGKVAAPVASFAAQGAGGAAAEEAVPDDWKGTANFAGQIATGGVQHIAGEAGRWAAGKIGEAVNSPALAITQGQRDRAAAQTILDRASEPGAVQEAAAAPLDEQQIVPGSRPDLYQLTGDAGLGQLARQQATKTPDPFTARRLEQGRAQVADLEAQKPASADPEAVSRFVRDQLTKMDEAHDAAAEQATQRVQDATSRASDAIGARQASTDASAAREIGSAQDAATTAIDQTGGQRSAAEYGADLRDNELAPERAAVKGPASAMWEALKAINPILDISPLKDAASELVAKLPKSNPPTPEEVKILAFVADMPKVSSYSEVQGLRERLGTIIAADKAGPAGATPLSYRMGVIRDGLDHAVATAAEREATIDAHGVAAGSISPEETLFARLSQQRESYIARRNGPAVSTGGSPGGSTERPALYGRDEGALRPDDRAGSAGEGRSGGLPGSEGVSAAPISGEASPLVAALSGDELGQTANFPQLSGRAASYAKQHLINRVVSNRDTGWDIKINGVGTRKSVHGKGEDLLRAIPALPELLEHGKLIGSEPDRHGRAEIRAMHAIAGRVEIGGVPHDLVALVKETRNGMQFLHYDIRKNTRGLPVSSREQRGEGKPSSTRPALESAPGARANIGRPSGADKVTTGVGVKAEPPGSSWTEQYRTAQKTWADLKQRFDKGAVGQALHSDGHGVYRMADEQVAARFVNEGKTSVRDMQQFIRAVGNRPAAVETLKDFLASKLRQSAVRPDGTLDLAKYRIFTNKYGAHLRAWPELARRFETAASAQQTLDHVTVRARGAQKLVNDLADQIRGQVISPNGTWNQRNYESWLAKHADRLAQYPEVARAFETAAAAQRTLQTTQIAAKLAKQEFQKSAAAKFLVPIGGNMVGVTPDPVATLGSILGNSNVIKAKTQMAELFNTVKDHPDALEGLKRLTIEWVKSRFVTGPENPAYGSPQIRPGAFQRFISEHGGTLRPLLGHDGVGVLKAISEDLSRNARSYTDAKLAGSPGTAQDLIGAKRRPGDDTLIGRALDALLHGSGVGLMMLLHKVPLAHKVATFAGALAMDGNIRSVDELVTQMVLHPALFHAAAAKIPPASNPVAQMAWAKRVAFALTSSAVRQVTPQPQRQHQPTSPVTHPLYAG